MELSNGRGSSALLDARDLYRFFHSGDDETLALKGVSLQVQAGEFVCILGPSGSGKSTLLGCLAGLDDPDGGSVTIQGERMSRRHEATKALLRAKSLGILMQSGNLLGHLTVEQNVALPQSLLPTSTRLTSPVDILESLGLGHRVKALPSTLSGGESARAGLAVALANDPALLLADEPTGEVDGVNESDILQLITARVAAGCAAIVVTHSTRVSQRADKIVRLVDGRVSVG